MGSITPFFVMVGGVYTMSYQFLTVFYEKYFGLAVSIEWSQARAGAGLAYRSMTGS